MRSPKVHRSGITALLMTTGIMSGVMAFGIVPSHADANPTPSGVTEQQPASPIASRGWLGVKVQNIDEDTAIALGLPNPAGALVTEVMPDGPAATAGLKPNDAILSLNGQVVASGKDLAGKVASLNPDSSVELKLLREGGEQTVTVKLGAGKAATAADAGGLTSDNAAPRLGLKVADGPDGAGVLIMDVDPSSDAASKGLATGDVIVQVAGAPVSTAAQVVERLKAAHSAGRKAVLLLVKTGDQTRSVPVRFKMVG